MKTKRIVRKISLVTGFLALVAFNYPATAAMSPQGQMIVVPEYTAAEKVVKSGNLEGAVELLNATLRKFPTHANAMNLLGFINRRLGKFDEAEKFYEGALTINPNHLGALNYMGQLFVQTGRPAKAKALLEHLKSVCKDGCEELDHLQKAIDSGVAGKY